MGALTFLINVFSSNLLINYFSELSYAVMIGLFNKDSLIIRKKKKQEENLIKKLL